MRPPICPDTLLALIGAGERLDCQLELALLRAGIVGAAPLDRVRVLLVQPDLEIRSMLDVDGRRLLSLSSGGTLVGVIDADGKIRHFTEIPRPQSTTPDSSVFNAIS